MKFDARKWINKTTIVLLFIIVLGLVLTYLGFFLINYTKDRITSMSLNETDEGDRWEVDWVTEHPHTDVGWLLLFIGLALLITGVIGILIWWKQNKKLKLFS